MRLSRNVVLFAFLSIIVGCSEIPTSDPGTSGSQPPSPVSGSGLVEVTITGIGTQHPSSTTRVLGGAGGSADAGVSEVMRASSSSMVGRVLTPLAGDGTVQLEHVSTQSFTVGLRGDLDAYRYVSTTYRVRNAHENGTIYNTTRTNLTFLAVSKTAGSLSGTNITSLNKFSGAAANPAVALEVQPSGAAVLNAVSGVISSAGADVLQVYTEPEVDITPPIGVASILPYGFVTRTSSNINRTIAASPAPGQFDGMVTFAYKVPLQTLAADDPFTITATFLPVDDSQKFVTRTLEESDTASGTAYQARWQGLNAIKRSLGTATNIFERVCNVRTAGTRTAPTAGLVPTVTMIAIEPDPYASTAGFIAPTTVFGATFCGPVFANSETIWVNRGLGPRPFFATPYTGSETNMPSTPPKSYFAGEVVEVSYTDAMVPAFATLIGAKVVRYRVVTGTPAGVLTGASASSAVTTPDPFAITSGDFNNDGNLDLVTTSFLQHDAQLLIGIGDGTFEAPILATAVQAPLAAAAADVNEDGWLDLVIASYTDSKVIVRLGDGTGAFTAAADVNLGGPPSTLALGDLNADGKPDLVVGDALEAVTVYLGDGAGGFSPDDVYTVGSGQKWLATGDLNNDGSLDIVAASAADNVINILLNDGKANFHEPGFSPIGSGDGPYSIALGDVNGDGFLDLAAADYNVASVAVWLNGGSGDFTLAPSAPFLVENGPRGVALADVNGDQKLDLLTANEAAGSVTIRLGDGAGDFAAPENLAATAAFNLVTGDFDGDMTLDVVVSNTSEGYVTTWMNP